MYKYIIILLIMIKFTTGLSCDDTIIIPDKETLELKLLPDYQYFNDKSGFINKVAGRVMYPIGVANSIEEALYDYESKFQGNIYGKIISKQIPMLRDELFKACLGDYPSVLEDLERKGLYEPFMKAFGK